MHTHSRSRIGLMALTVLLAGAGSAAAQDVQTWKHGLLNAKADAGFFMMSAKRGFAEKEGLKLELLQVKDDQIGLKAMLAGELDSFEGGPQGALTAAARGADIKILGCHWVVVPHGIFVNDKISKIEDLKGKSIAVSSPGTMPEMLAREALATHGIKPEDVKLAAVGGDRERYTALTGGVVDAAVVSNEYQPVVPKNIRLLVAGRDAVPKFVRVCIFSSGKTLAAKPDAAVKFMAAEMKALKFAVTHRDETIALTREISGMKADDPRPAFVYDDAVAHKAIAPDLPIPLEKLDWLQDQAVKAGRQPKAVDLKQMSADDLHAKALALAGK